MNQQNPPLESEQPKRILSQTDVEYTYDTDVQELKGDDGPLSVVVTITQVRTETKVWVYPGLDRTTEEVDEQRTLLFSERVSTNPLVNNCAGCGRRIHLHSGRVRGLKGVYHQDCHPTYNTGNVPAPTHPPGQDRK